MKRIIIIVVLFFTLLFSGCGNKKITSSVLPILAPTPVVDESSSKITFIPITDSQNGIEVTVEDVKKENGRTIIDLYLNNHQYDLAKFDVQSNSNLSGVEPSEYIIKSSVMGGHHVQAEMIFSEEVSGPLLIGLNDTLVFNFSIK